MGKGPSGLAGKHNQYLAGAIEQGTEKRKKLLPVCRKGIRQTKNLLKITPQSYMWVKNKGMVDVRTGFICSPVPKLNFLSKARRIRMTT